MAIHRLKFGEKVEQRIKIMKKTGNMETAALMASALALLDFCMEAERNGKKICVITPLPDEGQEIQRVVLPF